MAYWTGPQHV